MKHITNASHENCEQLWREIFGDTYQDKHDFIMHHDGQELKLSGGGGNYATYDICLAEDVNLSSMYDAYEHERLRGLGHHNLPKDTHFALSYTKEAFKVPNDLLLLVCSKSTIARCSINASFTTVIDPCFVGQSLTVEIVNLSMSNSVTLPKGTPIAQIVAIKVPAPCLPYNGKYQNQPPKPVGAK